MGALRMKKGSYHHYSKESHYKRNYKDYLATMKAKKLIKVYDNCCGINRPKRTTLGVISDILFFKRNFFLISRRLV